MAEQKQATATITATAAKKEPIKLYVERETFEKNDKTYYSYYIKGTVRGKDVKVALIPPDKGGYTVLDIVFGEDNRADLILNPYEIKDDATGKVIKGNTFAARATDEDGEEYECTVKPFRNSDKTLLNMLLKKSA